MEYLNLYNKLFLINFIEYIFIKYINLPFKLTAGFIIKVSLFLFKSSLSVLSWTESKTKQNILNHVISIPVLKKYLY